MAQLEESNLDKDLYNQISNDSNVDVERHQRSTMWQIYSQLVDRYHFLFELTDDAISRLLFFSPMASNEKGRPRWREVVWGLLQLHRLTLDIALRQRRCLTIDANHYGTTVAVQNVKTPAISVRIALTVLQSLGPMLQEVACTFTTDQVTIRRRQSHARAMIERIRFLLRGYLLIHYWRNIWKETRFLKDTERLASTPIGLLREGGLFPSNAITPTIQQERTRIEREQYVGRRSGWRLQGRQQPQQPAALYNRQTGMTTSPDTWPNNAAAKVIIGELLYIIQPLYQAETELRGDGTESSQPFASWLKCLTMDITSLWSLQPSVARGNHATQIEWNRRRLRLLLYMLRKPIWDRITRLFVGKVTRVIEMVPLIGRPCSNYLWEWLHYWRLYRAEEG